MQGEQGEIVERSKSDKRKDAKTQRERQISDYVRESATLGLAVQETADSIRFVGTRIASAVVAQALQNLKTTETTEIHGK